MGALSHDVVIVGAGPAGMFAALELVEHGGLEVAILDKGPDLEARRCPAQELPEAWERD